MRERKEGAGGRGIRRDRLTMVCPALYSAILYEQRAAWVGVSLQLSR